MKERIEITKKRAKKYNNIENPQNIIQDSFKIYSIDNCAEIFAADYAINHGAKINNLLFCTKEYRDKNNRGKIATLCTNCKSTFEDCYACYECDGDNPYIIKKVKLEEEYLLFNN